MDTLPIFGKVLGHRWRADQGGNLAVRRPFLLKKLSWILPPGEESLSWGLVGPAPVPAICSSPSGRSPSQPGLRRRARWIGGRRLVFLPGHRAAYLPRTVAVALPGAWHVGSGRLLWLHRGTRGRKGEEYRCVGCMCPCAGIGGGLASESLGATMQGLDPTVSACATQCLR